MNDKPRQWTKEEIKELLNSESFYEQLIDLPFGLTTQGKNREDVADKIFSEISVENKSVLDVGCCYGYFCFEAIKRGAKRVVGIDVDEDNIRKAKLLASILGVEVDFQLLDVDSETIQDKFDVVLCLDVIHQFKYPIHTLDKLGSLVKETMIFESRNIEDQYLTPVNTEGLPREDILRSENLEELTGLTPEEVSNQHLSSEQKSLIKTLPLILASPGEMIKHSRGNFLFTCQALYNVLTIELKRFTDIETVLSPVEGNYILFAHRRHIKKLIVIAGPTSCGKSTIINELVEGKGQEIKEACHLPQNANLVFSRELYLHLLKGKKIENLVLHYDIIRRIHTTFKTVERDPTLNILDDCEEVYVFTLYTDAENLRKQLNAGRIEGQHPPKPAYLILQKEYQSAERIQSYYKEWLNFILKRKVKHQFITFKEGKLEVHDRIKDLIYDQ